MAKSSSSTALPRSDASETGTPVGVRSLKSGAFDPTGRRLDAAEGLVAGIGEFSIAPAFDGALEWNPTASAARSRAAEALRSARGIVTTRGGFCLLFEASTAPITSSTTATAPTTSAIRPRARFE